MAANTQLLVVPRGLEHPPGASGPGTLKNRTRISRPSYPLLRA